MKYIVTRCITEYTKETVLVEVPDKQDSKRAKEKARIAAQDYLSDPGGTDYEKGVIIHDATERKIDFDIDMPEDEWFVDTVINNKIVSLT